MDAPLRRDGRSRPLSDPLLLTASGLVVFPDEAARLDDGGAFAWVVALRGQPVLRVPRSQTEALLAAFTRSARPPRAEMPAGMSLESATVAPRPRRDGAEQAQGAGHPTVSRPPIARLRVERPTVLAKRRRLGIAALPNARWRGHKRRRALR